MIHTLFDELLDATSEIWDDREAYIMAVLNTLGIDPQMPWVEWKPEQ